jgi:ABC-type multidrug transport system fused ATPase/permease subunit
MATVMAMVMVTAMAMVQATTAIHLKNNLLANFLLNNIVISTAINVRKTLIEGQKRYVIILFVLAFVSAILEVTGLAMILPVVNIAIHPTIIQNNKYVHFVFELLGFESQTNFSFFLFALIILFFIIKNISLLFISYLQNFITTSISGEIGLDLFKRYYKRDINFFNDTNAVDLLYNLTTVPVDFAANVLVPLIIFINELFVVLIIVLGVAFYNFEIFMLLLITIVPTFFIIFRVTKNKMVFHSQYKMNQYMHVNRIANDSIRGYIDVKLLDKENYFFEEYISNHKRMAKSSATIFSINQSSAKAIEVVSVFSILLILTIAILNHNNQQGILNIMTFFMLASYRLLPSLNKMLISLNNIKGFQYVFDILNKFKDSSNVVSDSLESTLKFEEKISLEKVSFQYPHGDKQILSEFSLKIKKGETIGIVGTSGSGKTTLINVILGFLKPTQGKIILDDVAVQEENLTAFRNLIGYVKQNVFILDGNILQNIALGVPDAEIDMQKMETAVKMAKLESIVNVLPKGLKTQIGEQGSKLSGGQKQRIAIARALYHNAEILVFDEATSALDNETEKEITEAIETLIGSKTMIIVAHRYSTLKNCNRIIEMKDGKIVNTMTYEQLIQSKL